MKNNRELTYPLILLAVVTVTFFSLVIFFHETFFLRDLTYIFQPWKTLCAQMIVNGKLPLWNHYSCCGMPLLANWQSAVFYPFSVFFYLFPFAKALKIFSLINLFTGAVFAYLFGRNLKLTYWQACAMGVLFAFNGYILSRMEFLSHFGTDIWIFALLLFINNPILLAVSLSFAFLAGHQMFFILLFILLLYSISDFNSFKVAKQFKSIAVSGCLAAGIVACQLLPTIELASFSERIKQGIDSGTAMLYSLKFSDLAGVFTPFWASLQTNLVGEKYDWIKTFHIGVFSAIIILFRSFLTALNNTKIFGLLLICLGLLFSLGNSTPVYPWLYSHIPFFRLLRYPPQFMYLAIVGFVIMLGESLRNARYSLVILFLIAAELIIVSWNFQARADETFFTAKPTSALFMQKNLKGQRFILSPGAEANRIIFGPGIVEGWAKSRFFLYGLVCLPYRISNAFGVGDPLVPGSVTKLIDTAYSKKDPKEALPLFRALGVKYLLSRNKLPLANGTLFAAEASLYIYEIPGEDSMFYSGDSAQRINNVLVDGNTVQFESDNSKEAPTTFIENFMPGWKAYAGSISLLTNASKEGFIQCLIPKGKNTIFMIYRPLSFQIGLFFSIMFVGFIIILAGIRAGRSLQLKNE